MVDLYKKPFPFVNTISGEQKAHIQKAGEILKACKIIEQKLRYIKFSIFTIRITISLKNFKVTPQLKTY